MNHACENGGGGDFSESTFPPCPFRPLAGCPADRTPRNARQGAEASPLGPPHQRFGGGGAPSIMPRRRGAKAPLITSSDPPLLINATCVFRDTGAVRCMRVTGAACRRVLTVAQCRAQTRVAAVAGGRGRGSRGLSCSSEGELGGRKRGAGKPCIYWTQGICLLSSPFPRLTESVG